MVIHGMSIMVIMMRSGVRTIVVPVVILISFIWVIAFSAMTQDTKLSPILVVLNKVKEVEIVARLLTQKP